MYTSLTMDWEKWIEKSNMQAGDGLILCPGPLFEWLQEQELSGCYANIIHS